MNLKHLHWKLIAILFLLSCNQKGVDQCAFLLKGFDSQSWKMDSIACNGYRKDTYTLLTDSSEDMVGLSRCQIIQFLGKPNRRYVRDGEKFYYWIEPGAQCLPIKKDTLYLSKFYLLFDSESKVYESGVIIP